MKYTLVLWLFLVMAVGISAEPARKSVPATLLTALDAANAKTGDSVSAQTSEPVMNGDRVVLPKGAKLLGHVVEVKVRSEGQPISELVIAFDRAVLSDGKEVRLAATIASISRAQSKGAPSAAASGDMGVPSSATGGGAATVQQGHSSGSPSGPPPTNAHSGDEGAAKGTGAFTLQQKGGRTVVSSNAENIHLAHGTQLLMQVKVGE